MTVNVLFGKKAGKIAELQLDASVREQHQYDNEVTQFPIESGATISDNIRLLPDRVDIDGFVTNAPITVVYEDVNEVLEQKPGETEVRTATRAGSTARIETARDILLRISGRKIQGVNQDPEIVDVVTGLRVYTGMVISSLMIPRDADMGQSLHFTATFIKFEFATADTVPQSVFKDKSQSQIDKSKQTPQNTTDKQSTQTSKIKSFWDKAVRNFGPGTSP